MRRRGNKPPEMTLEEYGRNVADFAHYPHAGDRDAMAVNYCALELNGEAGEFADQIKKAIRDDRFGFEKRCLTPERRMAAALELGDAFFALARAAVEIGYSLQDIAELNLAKLDRRYEEKAASGDKTAKEVFMRRRQRRLALRER